MGWKRRSRRLSDRTNTELIAIAAAALSGLRTPARRVAAVAPARPQHEIVMADSMR